MELEKALDYLAKAKKETRTLEPVKSIEKAETEIKRHIRKMEQDVPF